MRTRLLPILLLPVLIGGVPDAAAGEDPASAPWSSGSIAVIPFANHTEDVGAVTIVMREVYAELDRRGISYLSSEDIRPLLRRLRIRTSGNISERGLAAIAMETGVGACLLGSVDLYETEGVPEFGVSARVLRVGERTLARAASAAATGRDDPRLFDGGQVRDASGVMRDVVAVLFARLDGAPPRAENARPIAVIPFDDASDHPGAGDIVTNVLVSALVARGLPVIEPGILRDVALEKADLSRGSADHGLLQALATAFDPSVVVTGTVERFRAANGPTGTEIPEIEISARAIDPASRRLVWGVSTDKKGDDSETVFGRGRCYSVGRLTGDAIAALVDPIRELGGRHDVP